MEVKVQLIGKEKQESIEINCHKVTENIQEIISFVKLRQGRVTGMCEGERYEIPCMDIYYIESVDDNVFLYCKDEVYETRQKLYELEEMLGQKQFLRISKSCIVNLMKVKAIKPALNGRYIAVLISGEEIIISRKYVPELKNKLKGDK